MTLAMDDRRRSWSDRHDGGATLADPSPFVVRCLELLDRDRACDTAPSGRRALDVACGRGRHSLALAAHGYHVDAVDFALPALAFLRRTATTRRLPIFCLAADVTAWPLPPARYALVVVVNFLERSIFAALRSAVAPGGALLLETFLSDPAAPPAIDRSFLLTPTDLDAVCAGFELLAHHTGAADHRGQTVTRAGVLARRPRAAIAAAVAH